MFVPANVWYCCLVPSDKIAVATTASLFAASLNQPIELETFESAWSLSRLFLRAGLSAVMYYYGLEQTVILIPDEPLSLLWVS